MDFVKPFTKQIDDTASSVFNTYIKQQSALTGLLHLALLLYITRLAPEIPASVAVYIDNPYFKLFVFALVLWSAQLSPSTSILVALAFMMTMNYLNQKPVWEFLENTAGDASSAPVAPSKDVAMNVAAGSLDQSVENPESVQSVVQKTDTIVITPTIIDTPQGKQVVNPTVVVASLAVDTPQGTQMIKPDVTTVSISPQTPVQDVVPVPMIPQSQPQPQETVPVQISAESAPKTRHCFPVRKADMSKVTAFDDEQEFKSL